MSRKGKQPIHLPKGVEVKVADQTVHVKGPKGSLQHVLHQGILINVEDGNAYVKLAPDYQKQDDWHGLYWAIVHNMVVGASAGFEKKLELVGIGYRAVVSGHFLELQIGLSHPTKVSIPEGVVVKVEKTSITITGIDKQKVGQFAATVRALKPPEPYQGKGIRYANEYVRKKAGKAAAAKSK